MNPELRMAELLCTRLCHDLTGPIGAVHNGAEFLSEEGFSLQNQAVDLIVSSAHSAVSRLQFYRLAYGKVKDQGEACLSEKQKMAKDFFTDSKIIVDWPDSHTDASGVSISLKMSRLIFNLMIIAASTLIRGGTISVRIAQDDAGAKELRISANGTAVKWEPEMADVLNGKLSSDTMDARNVQLFLTTKLAEELGAQLTAQMEGGELVLHALQPQMPMMQVAM